MSWRSGWSSIETVNFAPGEPDQAHGPREYVDIQMVLDYTIILVFYLYRLVSVS